MVIQTETHLWMDTSYKQMQDRVHLSRTLLLVLKKLNTDTQAGIQQVEGGKIRFSSSSPSPSTNVIRHSTQVIDPTHPTHHLSDSCKAGVSATHRMHSILLHTHFPCTQPAQHPGCTGFPVPGQPHRQLLHRAYCSASKQKQVIKCLLGFHMMCLVTYCCLGSLLPTLFCHFGPRFCLLCRGMSLMEQLS